MDRMVERIAKAMLRERRGMVQWEDFPDLQQVYLKAAKAAISEISESVTPEMLHAAEHALARHAYEGWEDSAEGTRQVLELVVSAALKAINDEFLPPEL